EKGAPKMAEIAWVYNCRGETAVRFILNPLMVSTASGMLGRWYRGELKAKGMPQELLDFGEKMRLALVTGDLMPGGEPIPSDQLTDRELSERRAADGGALT